MKKKENIGNYFMQGTAYATMFTEMTGIPVHQIIILIGVDTANFCQTLTINTEEMNTWRQELQKYIDAYQEKFDLIS